MSVNFNTPPEVVRLARASSSSSPATNRFSGRIPYPLDQQQDGVTRHKRSNTMPFIPQRYRRHGTVGISTFPTFDHNPFQVCILKNTDGSMSTKYSYVLSKEPGEDGKNKEIILGKGGFKTVYLVRDENEVLLAMSKLSKVELGIEAETFMHEAKILQESENEYVVRYLDQIVEPVDDKHVNIYIFTEFCHQGTLSDIVKRLHEDQWLCEEQIVTWMIQLLQVFSFLQSKNPCIIHRDVKPDNIFLTGTGDVRLGDFGIAVAINRSTDMLYGDEPGTVSYMAPEMSNQSATYGAPVDMFGLGCVLFELCTKKPKFFSWDAKHGGFEKYRPDICKHYTDNLASIIISLLDADATKRPRPEELLKTEFVKKHLQFHHPYISNNYMFRHILSSAMPLFEEGSAITAEFNDFLATQRELDHIQILQDWSDTLLEIPVIGMIKAGKTSFINAMLGADILPCSNVPETVDIVRIAPARHSYEEPVLYNDSGEKVAEGVQNINHYLHLKHDRARAESKQQGEFISLLKIRDIIRRFDKFAEGDDFDGNEVSMTLWTNVSVLPPVYSNNDYYPEVQLIDTPGPNEYGKINFQQLMGRLLRRMGTFIYVFDYTKLNTMDEASFLLALQHLKKDLLAQSSNRMVFVVNKFDQKRRNGKSYEETVQYVKEILKENLAIEVEDSQIIPCSSHFALLSRTILSDTATEDNVYDFDELAFDEFSRDDATWEQRKERALRYWEKSNMNAVMEKIFEVVKDMCARTFLDDVLLRVQKNLYTTKRLGQLALTGMQVTALPAQVANTLASIKKNGPGYFKEFKRDLYQDLKKSLEVLCKECEADIESMWRCMQTYTPEDAVDSTFVMEVLYDKKELDQETMAKIDRWRNRIPLAERTHFFTSFERLGVPPFDVFWLCSLHSHASTARLSLEEGIEFVMKKIYQNLTESVNREINEKLIYTSEKGVRARFDPLLESLQSVFGKKLSRCDDAEVASKDQSPASRRFSNTVMTSILRKDSERRDSSLFSCTDLSQLASASFTPSRARPSQFVYTSTAKRGGKPISAPPTPVRAQLSKITSRRWMKRLLFPSKNEGVSVETLLEAYRKQVTTDLATLQDSFFSGRIDVLEDLVEQVRKLFWAEVSVHEANMQLELSERLQKLDGVQQRFEKLDVLLERLGRTIGGLSRQLGTGHFDQADPVTPKTDKMVTSL